MAGVINEGLLLSRSGAVASGAKFELIFQAEIKRKMDGPQRRHHQRGSGSGAAASRCWCLAEISLWARFVYVWSRSWPSWPTSRPGSCPTGMTANQIRRLSGTTTKQCWVRMADLDAQRARSGRGVQSVRVPPGNRPAAQGHRGPRPSDGPRPARRRAQRAQRKRPAGPSERVVLPGSLDAESIATMLRGFNNLQFQVPTTK